SGGSISPSVVADADGFVPGQTAVTVLLNQPDITDILTSNGDLAESASSTWLAMGTGAFADMAGNGAASIPQSNALQVSLFSAPRIFTQLVNLSLNLDQAQLVLTFNAVVNPASLKVQGIV